eukprot:2658133-Prymnesium_polylepis.1
MGSSTPDDKAAVAVTTPMRESVSQVQYQRWRVAEEHKHLAIAERDNNTDFKQQRHHLLERHLEFARSNKERTAEQEDRTRQVRDGHAPRCAEACCLRLTRARHSHGRAQSVESSQLQKKEVADDLRLRLSTMTSEARASREAWADHGRQLVREDTARARSAKRSQVCRAPTAPPRACEPRSSRARACKSEGWHAAHHTVVRIVWPARPPAAGLVSGAAAPELGADEARADCARGGPLARL